MSQVRKWIRLLAKEGSIQESTQTVHETDRERIGLRYSIYTTVYVFLKLISIVNLATYLK